MASSVAKILAFSLFLFLAAVSFFIIRPFISAILTALVLAYIFRPLHLKLNKLIKQPTISSFIVSLLVMAIIAALALITLQIAAKQVVDLYTYSQSADIIAPLKAILAKFTDPAFSGQISYVIDSSLEKAASFIINWVSMIIVDLPYLLLQLIVTFFIMFYFIKDGEVIVSYLKNILPFEDVTRDKFFKRFEDITSGVIYGTIFVGLIQGVVAGIGLFLFGVPGAFLLTLMCIILSILPIGPWVVWLPAGINLILQDKVKTGVGLLIFGFFIVTYIDNIVRPYFVGRRAKMNQIAILLGILGGVSLFGLIGVIVGPIIIDYLIIFIEIYRTGHLKDIIKEG